MDIGDKIKELTNNLIIPCYYIKRPQSTDDCIVYTYIEIPKFIGDMQELTSKYTILFNIYCKTNIEKNKKQVKEVLEKHGFKKKIILQTILEDNGFYNTAMQYTISLKN